MSLSAIVMPIAARSLPREHPTCHTIPVSLQSELRLGWPFAAVPAIIGRLDDHSFGGERRAELEPNYFANGATKPLIPLGALKEHRHPVVSRHDRRIRTHRHRSEEHTSELQSLMRISYAVFCLKKKTT